MAYKNPLATWLFSQRTIFFPNFTELDWPMRFGPGLFDFSTQIKLGDILADGRGVDTDREIALEKSVAESIERLICTKLKISSVGVAVSGAESSETHARFEALERYFLNKHLEKEIPFSKIENPALDKIISIQKHRPQSKVMLYQMAISNELCGVVCIIKEGGVISPGFALSVNIENSIRRAYFEALPNFARLIENSNEKIPSEFWHIQTSFIEKLTSLLVPDNNFTQLIKTPTLVKQNLNLNDIPELIDCPIKPVRFLTEEGLT